jgi:hypothetical protein
LKQGLNWSLSRQPVQQLGGSDYTNPMLVEISSEFDATRYPMQSPYYALPYEVNVGDQEVLYPLHDSTTLALQREYTATDTNVDLVAALPGIERVEWEECFE